MNPEHIAECVKSGRINLYESCVGIHELELILTVLRMRGNVSIENCHGVMSLMEMGAYLNALSAK